MTDSDELKNLAGWPDYPPVRAELTAGFKELRVDYSGGGGSGLPELSTAQKENTANRQGCRSEYLKLKGNPRSCANPVRS